MTKPSGRTMQWSTLSFLMIVCIFVLPAQAKYGGGTGEPNDPHLIYTAEQINAIGANRSDWHKHFRLMADIDLSGFDGKEGRPAFNRIAPDADPAKTWFQGTGFLGVFDGNGHTISHLAIKGVGFLGLFGRLGYGGEVKDLEVVGVDITGSEGYVGGLVGLNSGLVTRCCSSGTVSGDENAGGLVGQNGYGADVTLCYSTATVEGSSEVGGLAGSNAGTLTRCYSTGAIAGNKCVGGLVGENSGLVIGCYSTGAVSGNELLGGLVGRGNPDRASHSLWDTEASGQGTGAGGMGLTTAEMMDPVMLGLNGFGGDPAWVLDSALDYPRLAWQGTPGEIIPEPTVDWLDGAGTPADPFRIETAQQFRLIHKSSILWDKHFALNSDIDLDPNLPGRCIFERAVIPVFEGSFFGDSHEIVNLRAEGADALGLFGRLAKGSVVRDLGLENVSIHGTGSYVGGLSGHNAGDIINCYCSGVVSGNDRVGGLVGRNEKDGFITTSQSAASVTGSWNVGGLVGRNYGGSIAGSYSAGAVAGDSTVGGLVGRNSSGTVDSCYSIGTVSGDQSVGGLVGSGDPNSVSSGFWDVETSGQDRSSGGTGLSTAQMMDIATYLDAGWDFVGETENGTEDVWFILEGQDYPGFVCETNSREAVIPYPYNGALDIMQPVVLSWISGARALYHDIYFGEDQQVVANATTQETGVYRGQQAAGTTTYHPGALRWDQMYYWRIDEVNETDANSPRKANVWSFTTAHFIVVDDFESYNDIDPPDLESNRIFDVWIDGFGTATNGALVGEFGWWERATIVHSGTQSMLFAYDNNLKTSEATRTLISLRDWTEGGATMLSLWFRGNPANSAEPMFVALDGTAVVYHENSAATQMVGWNEWVILLDAFTDQGVNLANVNTITIGLGTKNPIAPRPGGTGRMYFDDIRLYRPNHQQEPASTP